MTKYFMVSGMVPETHLHEVMSLLESAETHRITAAPVPFEFSQMVVTLASNPDPFGGMTKPKKQEAPKQLAPPKPLQKNGKKAPQRADASIYAAMKDALDGFISKRDLFHRSDLINVLKKPARGYPYNADAKIYQLVKDGKLERLGGGRYRVVREVNHVGA